MELVLSIIIPIYGVEKYLNRCLDVLVEHEYVHRNNKIEIILVDDGSVDNCPKICDEYASKSENVRVIHKNNGGLASARNAGLDMAKGKWIAFIDPDDMVVNDYLTSVIKMCEKYSDVDCILFGMIIKNAKNGKIYLYDNPCFCGGIVEWIRIAEKRGLLNYSCNKIYKRSVIEGSTSVRFKEGKEPGEDLIFNCEYLERCQKAVMIEEHLYVYHKQCDTEESLSHKFWPDLNEKTELFIKSRCHMYEVMDLCLLEDQKELAKQNIYYIYKCIPNMYKRRKTFERKKRREFYKKIMEDKQIRKWMEIDPNQEKVMCIFKILYKIKSVTIFDVTYSILFEIRNYIDEVRSNWWIRNKAEQKKAC